MNHNRNHSDTGQYSRAGHYAYRITSDVNPVRVAHGTIVYMHHAVAEMMGLDVAKGIVHINGDTLDNRRENLQESLSG